MVAYTAKSCMVASGAGQVCRMISFSVAKADIARLRPRRRPRNPTPAGSFSCRHGLHRSVSHRTPREHEAAILFVGEACALHSLLVLVLVRDDCSMMPVWHWPHKIVGSVAGIRRSLRSVYNICHSSIQLGGKSTAGEGNGLLPIRWSSSVEPHRSRRGVNIAYKRSCAR